MKYLLDTCTISYFIRGDANAMANLKNCAPHLIHVSSISIMEIEYGLLLNPIYGSKIRSIISKFLDNVCILPYAANDAFISATLRAGLKKNGRPVGAYDLLLAGTAINHNLILVTSNTKEFSHIPSLKLQDWQKR